MTRSPEPFVSQYLVASRPSVSSRPTSFARPILVLATVAALFTCGEARSGGEGTGGAMGLAGPDVQLAAVTEDLYTVGAIDGEDWETFGSVGSVAFDAEGNLHVFDRGAHRIVVVAPGGDLLRTVGQEGEGPGEIGGPMAAATFPDGRTAVFEFGMPGAFEVFGPDGSHLETVTVDITKGVPGDMLVPLPDGRMLTAGGGRVRLAGPGSSPDGDAEDEPAEDRRPLQAYSLDGTDPQSFYEAWDLPPAGEGEEATAADEGGRRVMTMRMARTRAFEPGLYFGVLSDGSVALADSIGWRVKLLAPDGAVASTLERPIVPLQVTASMEEEERTRRLAALEGGPRITMVGVAGGLAGGGELPAAMQEAMRRGIEEMIFADEVPVIANLAVDLEDRIWIARSGPLGEDDGPTDIATPTGDYMGTLPSDGLRIPDAFGPGGLMAYLESDDLGVETVRVIRLISLER